MEPIRNVFGEIDYPTSDGEPMGETDLHRQMMVDLIEALRHYYRDDPQTYVSGNILLYYEEGNPQAHLSPDVLVTRGLANRPRETYKLWVEGKAPEVVVEVTSRSTRLRDVGVKKGLYEALGVREYILFDPREEYLLPRFQVFRREGAGFVPCLVPEQVGYSSDLGLTFRVVDGVLRIFAPDQQVLPTPAELGRMLESEREAAEHERQAAEQERQAAEHERMRAERLAEQLRAAGLEPEV